MLDLRVASISTDREAHRLALRSAMDNDFVARCERTKTQADLDCAMAAKTTSQLRACRGSR